MIHDSIPNHIEHSFFQLSVQLLRISTFSSVKNNKQTTFYLQVQKSIHLPLPNLSAPRVLMCSASVDTEGSVTLQLRDANSSSSDSNQSPVPADSGLENALTIGYPDPEMLADVFGTIQTACKYARN